MASKFLKKLFSNNSNDYYNNMRESQKKFQEQSTRMYAENLARTGFSDSAIMGATGYSQNQIELLKNQNGIL